MEKQINEMLLIQSKLNAPKNQYNGFGKYKYRSCEDILEALKPLLTETKCSLTLTDDIVAVGERVYVKATATLTTQDGVTWQTTAFAREAESKSGMDVSQITGAASSYARKYALNGLFCIDDNKDADSLSTSKDFTAPAPATKPAAKPAGKNDKQLEEAFAVILPNIQSAPSKQYLQDLHKQNEALHDYEPYRTAMNKRFKEVQ